LHAGDRLILYTDGLIENFGTDGEREGKDRFHAFMEKSHHLPTKDLVDRVFEDANWQRGGSAPSDDMSLIAVEYTKR
jgi:serine phosphatase RsbU (regulator of sigma subunit)